MQGAVKAEPCKLGAEMDETAVYLLITAKMHMLIARWVRTSGTPEASDIGNSPFLHRMRFEYPLWVISTIGNRAQIRWKNSEKRAVGAAVLRRQERATDTSLQLPAGTGKRCLNPTRLHSVRNFGRERQVCFTTFPGMCGPTANILNSVRRGIFSPNR